MMDVQPIKTEVDCNWALAEIEYFFDAEPESGTPGSQRFDVLASPIERCESWTRPIGLPNPVEAIRHHMGQGGFTPYRVKAVA